jgi:hypothetical protein
MSGSLTYEDYSPGLVSKKQNPVCIITEGERAGAVAQAVEYLPPKREALILNPSPTKNQPNN